MKKGLLMVLVLVMFTNSAYAFDLFGYSFGAKKAEAAEKTEEEVAAEKAAAKEKQIELLESLGVLKTSNKLDASGTAIIMIMTRDNTGVYSYQHLTTADSNNIEAVMAQRGLIKNQFNKETGKVEKHIMVFNPKDNQHGYTWVPLTKAREVAKRIKETGYTYERQAQPRRLNSDDIREMNYDLSF
jgi:hypothetical protein